MQLVQILLPLRDNEGKPFPPAEFARLRTVLTDRFGGLTAYTRAPAQGIWDPEDGPGEQRDDVVIYEVMADPLDRAWWAALRRELEERFRQDEVVVRASEVERL
jgi:hypothetical protein